MVLVLLPGSCSGSAAAASCGSSVPGSGSAAASCGSSGPGSGSAAASCGSSGSGRSCSCSFTRGHMDALVFNNNNNNK